MRAWSGLWSKVAYWVDLPFVFYVLNQRTRMFGLLVVLGF